MDALTRAQRTAALALIVAVVAFGAVGISKPLPVHASYASAYLVFYCEHAGAPNHPDKVYVEGYNQNLQYVGHQFPAYYTYDYPTYWWWAINSTVGYNATYHGYTDSSKSWTVVGSDGQTDYVGAPVC